MKLHNLGRRLFAGSVALCLTPLVLLPSAASAATLDDGYTFISGGHVQHEDPTSYDFVPAPDDDTYPHIQDRSAWGQAWIGGISIRGVSIPTIVLTHDIKGSGLKIDREQAYAMSSTGRICNYRIDFQNRNGGTIYHTLKGPTYWGCHPIGTSVGGNNSRAPYTVNKGAQCARLFINGDFVGEQCHSIHP